MEDLKSQIEQVRKYRIIEADQKEAINERMLEWQDKNEDLLAAYDSVKKERAEAEEKLRKLTLEAYAADPSNKKPAPGVGIKIVKKCNYDAEKAFQYAKLHGVCLELDEKAFVALALKSKDTDIPATISEEAQATIAKELEA